jgi:Domain of unknown function (DUF4159)
MTSRRILVPIIAAVALAALALVVRAAQYEGRGNRWAQYEPEMQDPIPDPPNANVEAEFAVGRLRYRSPMDNYRRGQGRRWGNDANKGDRIFSSMLNRLTRINVRPIEQIVDADSDDMYDWPWLFASAVGDWELNDSEVAHLKKYFDRGGFLMVDDFHNEREWRDFANGINRILPRSHFVELQDDDPIFHTVYDLSERYQVSGLNILYGSPSERGGIVPHWRGVVDEKGRIQVAIDFNMDVGDSWEWADYPPYPERLSALGMRMGVNYVMYAMSH